jgi:ATP-dependent RNA helicase CshB
LTEDGIKEVVKKFKGLSVEEVAAVRSVKKPTKVKPNYKKKNKALVDKAKRIARYGGSK